MKKYFLVSISVFLFPVFSFLSAQKLERNPVVIGSCYAGDKVNRIYIPPPGVFFDKKGAKGGATISFSYTTDFPADVINAIEYAGSILEAMLPPDAHIDVLASWSDLGSSGILAQSSTTGYAPGWGIDAHIPYAFYPAALAEKIAGKSLNSTREGDIELYVNSSVNWYRRTDGRTSILQYDLVTVVIHELIHGLGFFDSFNVNETNGSGSYGIASIPVIYDTFVENLARKKLTDTLIFLNPSISIKTELTSGQLYFDGPLLSNFTSGGRARLWSPSTFDPGSSVSHLDEDDVLPINSLMTPYIDRGEAIHDPGKYIFSMLGDLGWINTRIIHEPPKDTEEYLTQLIINASVKSDTTYDHNRVGLVWSFDNFNSSDTVYLSSPQSNDFYTTVIPVAGYNKRLDYYLFTEDCFSRIYRSPSFIKEFRHSVYIGTDTVKPVIAFNPVDYYFELIDSVNLDAEISDNLGIDTVYVEYRINNGISHYAGMIYSGGDKYRLAIKTKTLGWTDGDSLRYRIIAVDKAALANQGVAPASGFYSAGVERVKPAQDSYNTDFSDASADFYNDGFMILKPSGFSKPGLNTPHPYVSPEETGDSIGYTSTLLVPVKFDDGGMILSYMEAVLVEPGEEGSLYATKYFYDYVIAEGSVNFGKSWFPLSDGYDSRYADIWKDAWLSSVDGQNSTFVGNESLLRKHSIFIKKSSDLAAGDSLMIRFRLFSDPYSNGWGWIIQDLHLGPLIDQVEDVGYQHVTIYPNPGNGLVRIRQPENLNARPVKYSVFNAAGICLMTGVSSGGPEFELNISAYPSGFYLIVLYRDDGVMTLKYSLVK